MKTILKILAALMLLTGGYDANSLNPQEHAATDSVTATIMRIRDEMLIVCDTTTNFMFSRDDKLTNADSRLLADEQDDGDHDHDPICRRLPRMGACYE